MNTTLHSAASPITLPLSVTAPLQREGLSSRYQLFPTADLVTRFLDSGYAVVGALGTRSRTPERRASSRHLLRLRPTHAEPIHGVYPEVVLVNSHDGTTALRFAAGLFRLVCSNGLIVAEGGFAPLYVVRHAHLDAAFAAAQQALDAALLATDVIPRLVGTSLTLAAQAAYAARAAALARPTVIDPALLLQARREEDIPENLWTVYNRVQENLLAGGVSVTAFTRGRLTTRLTRAVRSVTRTLDLNTALWDLTTEFAA